MIGLLLVVTLATVLAVDVRGGDPGSPRPAGRASGVAPSHSAATLIPPTGPTGSTDIAPDSQVPAHPAEAIDALLDQRATAVRDGDRVAWLAALDPSSDPAITRFRRAQSDVFDRVRTLRPSSWSYQVAGGSALPDRRRTALGGQAWLADVQLDYQLTPGGARVRREQFLTVVRRDGGWRIAADTDGSTGRDVWDLGPVSHAGAERCLVVGARARRTQIAQLAAECGAAARTVDVAWGRSWTRRTVLTVPGTLQQLAMLLGRTGSGTSTADATVGLEKTAAVTIGPAEGPAEEVLINGDAFDDLRSIGRRVVLTHELVHVATRATGSRDAPTWLEEGYADYVAYAGTHLPAEQIAGAALDAVAAGHGPAALPGPNDFNAAGDGAAAAYGQAWVAVQLIAAKAGSPARTKSFYQRAAAGSASPTSKARQAAVDAALARIGVHGTAAFVPLWQARLRRLAAS